MSWETEVGPGAQASLQEIADAREQAVVALANVRAEHSINPTEVTFGESPMSDPHAAVFRFFDVARPYRLGAPDEWHDTGENILGQFHVPQSFSKSSPGRGSNQIEWNLLDDVPEVVTLRGLLALDEWRNRSLVYERGHSARERQQQERRVWLPLSVLQSAVDALNDALVSANLAAQIAENEVDADPV